MLPNPAMIDGSRRGPNQSSPTPYLYSTGGKQGSEDGMQHYLNPKVNGSERIGVMDTRAWPGSLDGQVSMRGDPAHAEVKEGIAYPNVAELHGVECVGARRTLTMRTGIESGRPPGPQNQQRCWRPPARRTGSIHRDRDHKGSSAAAFRDQGSSRGDLIASHCLTGKE